MGNDFDIVATLSSWEHARTIEIGKTGRLGSLFANPKLAL